MALRGAYPLTGRTDWFMASFILLLCNQVVLITAVITPCNSSLESPTIVCVSKYFSVLPGNFSRASSTSPVTEDTIASISVPGDTTFSAIVNATFLVFDQVRASTILSASSALEIIFTTSPDINHEAPIYHPNLNGLFFTQVAPDVLEQGYIDLNASPPTLSYVLANPPIFAPTGSAYKDGLIYWGTTGNNISASGDVFKPGLYTFDPATNKSETLLNNYFGYDFNGVDDIALESNGDIWFTDDDYSWLDKTSIRQPVLRTATYRFRPSTGSIQVVNVDLEQPNGIRFSPDESILYLTDTGIVGGSIDTPYADISVTYTSNGPRTVWAYDVEKSTVEGGASRLGAGRPIYNALDWVPDGLQVAGNGYLVTASGNGVDVLSAEGELILRIQTSWRCASIEFVGSDLWIVGAGHIARVNWGLSG